MNQKDKNQHKGHLGSAHGRQGDPGPVVEDRGAEAGQEQGHVTDTDHEDVPANRATHGPGETKGQKRNTM